MIRKSIFDTPTTPRISVFLEWVRDGQLFIPDFQRPFEWDDERRLNLLDSVSRGLPIGAFMVWRTMRDLKTYDSLGPFELPKPQPNEPRNFLIDGHQRLVTLYAALQPITLHGLEQLRQEGRNWPVYFNLAAGDNELGFVIAPRRRGFQPPESWLPTNELFVPKALWRRQSELFNDGQEQLADRIEELANAFKDYAVPVLPLVTDDMKAVTDSFVRVNIGGKAMAEDKVLRALTYVDYRIDEHIEELREQLAEIGWDQIKEQVFISALKFRLELDVYGADPSNVVNAVKQLAEKSDSQDEGQIFRAKVAEVGRGLKAAALILERCGIPGPGILPYQYQLVCLAEALLVRESLEISHDEVEYIRKWIWYTIYSNHFTGLTGAQLRETVSDVVQVLDIGGFSTLWLNATQVKSRVEPVTRFRKSSIRSIAHMLMQANSIPDAEFRQQVLDRLGRQDLEAVHKIFPRSASRFGNVVLTVPEKLAELRKYLKTSPHDMPPAFAASHFIPMEALAVLSVPAAEQEIEHFCMLREQHLLRLEADFIRQFDLEMDLDDDDVG